ncbi:hypothetical protein [Luteibacter yeojuensis]
MSRTLARLRVVTSDPLLVRAGRGMVLTPYAEVLRGRTRDLVHEAVAMLRPAVSETDVTTLRRTFTIRTNDGFVEAFGPLLIANAGPRAIHAFELPLKTPGITVSQMWHPRLDRDSAHRWLRKLVLVACRGEAD